MSKRAEMTVAPLSFRAATIEDAAEATALINAAYRGDSSARGWTSEAHLLLGRRIDERGLRGLIATPGSIVLLCFQDEALIGSLLLQACGDNLAYLGMFVVTPDLQGRGLGRLFLREAEKTARSLWGATRMRICVISLRRELIAYYERRGYRLIGQNLPFPFEDGLSVAQVDGIELAAMEKDLPVAPIEQQQQRRADQAISPR